MNIFLFWTYISSIIVFILVIMVIFFVWGDYFPHKMLILLVLSFMFSAIGLLVLLISEMMAPYSNNFYFNPLLYSAYLAIFGCTFFTIYLLVIEIHFKHIRILTILGWLGLIEVLLLFLATIGSFLMSNLTSYNWVFYSLIAVVFWIGIAAYGLMAIGSFRDSKSDRLEKKHQRGLKLLGIYSFLIADAFALIAWSLYISDFSVAPDPLITVFWLIWIDLVVLVFLNIVRRAVQLIP